jgi:ABC-type Fe3+/spermidine/putrescine transport system ATPase subunit
MRAGWVAQVGTPQEIYCRPDSEFVARFVGLNNILPGEVQAGQVVTPIGSYPLETQLVGPVAVLLRPDRAALDGSGDARIEGVVEEIIFKGETSRITVIVNQTRLQFDFPTGSALPGPGESVRLDFDPQSGIQVFQR